MNANSNTEAKSLSGSSFISAPLRLCVFALISSALAWNAVSETRVFVSKMRAGRALQAARAGAKAEAMNLARASLAADPNNTQSQYLLASKLKDAGEIAPGGELDRLLERMLETYPSQSAARRLAGEIAFRRGDFSLATERLWEGMWINPTPPSSPANYWRMTMVASARMDRRDDALAAARRAEQLAPRDPLLSPREREELARDVAATRASVQVNKN